MKTNFLKTFFTFTRQQQNGIFFLLLLVVLLQCLYFFTDITPGKHPVADNEVWPAFQQHIDSLKQLQTEKRKPKVYPFNPNYLSDYKAYTLGMSVAETDRLLAYRTSGKFINSAEAFQQVTGISDSLLRTMAPYFKFPAWVTQKRASVKNNTTQVRKPVDKDAVAVKKDMNTATAEELRSIRGIGDVLSERIVKFRNRLGGFLIDEQLYDVYGLPPETARNILQRYTVVTPPPVKKININTASAKELSSVAYIRYKAAYAIVNYRDSVGNVRSLEELTKIPYIPIEKIDRIKLYFKIE